jgi:imidazoleglycerol phosphate synthase glutamine amidotransferase subunit HisH
MIVIIDYGMGNLGSVLICFKRIGTICNNFSGKYQSMIRPELLPRSRIFDKTMGKSMI